MPNFDQTGPQGQGSKTGRGLGPCGGGLRMGFRRSSGCGRGLGRYFGWNTPQTKDEKIKEMQDYKKALEEEIEETQMQLADLDKQE